MDARRSFFSRWLTGPLAAVAVAVLVGGCETPPEAPAAKAPEIPAANITQVRVFTVPAPVGAEALIERHRLSDARVGYVLYDLDSGEKLAARNENELFIPASTAKVPTAVAALHILGPEFRFETLILASGHAAEGILEGDLYLKGAGDPLLQAQDLMDLAGQLKDKGVTKITGRFYYDAGLLRSAPRIEAGQPDMARYNPGLGALSLDFNQTLLTWRPTGVPGTVEAFETPTFDEAGPGLNPTDPGPGRNVDYAGPGGSGRWLLSPNAPQEGTEFLPVKRPGLRTARVFRRLCKMLGIDLPEPAAAPAPADTHTLGRVRSLALADIVRRALEHSNNLVAELIGQVAARRLTGGPGTLAQSSSALNGWWKARLPETAWDGYHIPNHSGLASGARASPEQMAAIIRFAAGQRTGGGSTLSLLPVSGFRDAMLGRLSDPATALRVWAKTGTLKYAKGFTGILFTQQGRQVAFALYVTDFRKRLIYDVTTDVLEPAPAARAEDWIRRAEALEEDLVREWIIGF